MDSPGLSGVQIFITNAYLALCKDSEIGIFLREECKAVIPTESLDCCKGSWLNPFSISVWGVNSWAISFLCQKTPSYAMPLKWLITCLNRQVTTGLLLHCLFVLFAFRMLLVLWHILRHMEASARGFYSYSVGSREEWRSKWKSNLLEVINYPALEISLLKISHGVCGGSGICALALLWLACRHLLLTGV